MLNTKNSLQLRKQRFSNTFFCGVTTCCTTIELFSYHYLFFSGLLATEVYPVSIKPLDEPDALEIIRNFINNQDDTIPVNKDGSEGIVKSLPPINIKPLHDYDIHDFVKFEKLSREKKSIVQMYKKKERWRTECLPKERSY